MEQNNWTGCQEAGPEGVGGVSNGQGFAVVAAVPGVVLAAGGGATDGSAIAGAVYADAGGAGAAIGVAVGGDGDVAGATTAAGAVAAGDGVEQNNWATRRQEVGAEGVGGVFNDQGFVVVAAVPGAVDGSGAADAGSAIGVAFSGDGDVAVATTAAAGEQNNSATGLQEAGAGVSNDQGFVVVAAVPAGGGDVDGNVVAAVDGGTSAVAADGGGAAGIVVAGDACGVGVAVGGDGDVAVGGGDTVSGVAVAAGDGTSSQSARGKKRENFRHTKQQTDAMEAYFKKYPYPNKSQRSDLAGSLGMDHAQVKCWFQNKRSQMKSHYERREFEALRSENDVLRTRRNQCIEALSNDGCPQCRVDSSGVSAELRLENIRLKEKMERLKSTLARYRVRQNQQNFPITLTQNPQNHQNQQNPSMTILQSSQYIPMTLTQNPQHLAVIPVQNLQNLRIISQNPQYLPIIYRNPQNTTSTTTSTSGEGINLIRAAPTSDESRQSLINLAVSAADELKVMATAGGPLWISSSSTADASATSVLNEEEYLAMFPNNFGPTRLGYKCEGSRHVARVGLNPTQLLNILMNMKEWGVMFSAIVSSARTLEVLREGRDYNAALHVMAAEYFIPTPLVPNRNAYFARYCTKHSEGIWAVVDVSVDNILPTPKIITCQKKPSGCVIQEMADGTSKITWIEHVYADYNGVSNMYKRLLLSGLGFGARRWVSALERQCQLRMTAVSGINVPSTNDFNHLLMSSPEGRQGILKLAERLVNSFLLGFTGPKTGRWTTMQGNFGEDVRLMSKRVMNNPGLPNGTLLSVATSFSLSLAPTMVFEFFRNHRSRKEWDIFAKENDDYEQVFQISYGEEAAGKCVSIYKVPTRRQGQMQESWSDPVASHIVFAPTEIRDINMILRGGNPNVMPFLPSGFVILPDGHRSGTTLLTVSFQTLMTTSPVADIGLEAAAQLVHLLRLSCQKINHALAAIQ